MKTGNAVNDRKRRLAVVALLIVSASVGAAESGVRRPPAVEKPAIEKPAEAKTAAGKPKAASQARWASLPADTRREIRALYERMRQLSPEERRSLIEKLRALDPPSRKKVLDDARTRAARKPVERQATDLRRELLRSRVRDLTPADRDRLKGMSAEDRARYFGRLVQDRRERLLAQVPPEDRARVRGMPLREQAEYLARHRGQQLLVATFPDPRDVGALEKLPPSKVSAMLRAARSPAARPPPGVSAEGWRRWLDLKPYERTRVLGLILGTGKAGTAPKGPSDRPKGAANASPRGTPPR